MDVDICNWLIDSKYILANCRSSNHPLSILFNNQSLNIPLLKYLDKYIDSRDLWDFVSKGKNSITSAPITKLFSNRKFTPEMLKLLLEHKPDINLTCRDEFAYYPFSALLRTPIETIWEFLLIINCYQKEIQITPNYTGYRDCDKYVQLNVNRIAQCSQSNILNPKPVELLVKLSGELFKLIKPEYLTLEISNSFYNSEWFKTHPEEINLIPDKFHSQLVMVKSGSKTKPGFRSELSELSESIESIE